MSSIGIRVVCSDINWWWGWYKQLFSFLVFKYIYSRLGLAWYKYFFRNIVWISSACSVVDSYYFFNSTTYHENCICGFNFIATATHHNFYYSINHTTYESTYNNYYIILRLSSSWVQRARKTYKFKDYNKNIFDILLYFIIIVVLYFFETKCCFIFYTT